MSNAIIAVPHLSDAGTLSTISSEVVGLEAANLQDPILSRPWRTTGVSSIKFDIDLGLAPEGGHGINTFSFVRTNATPHRNLVTKTDALTDAAWVAFGLNAAPVVDAAVVDPFIGRRAWKILESSAFGTHHLNRVYTKPSSDSMRSVFSWYVRGISRDRCAITLLGSGSNGARTKFNLTALTVEDATFFGNVIINDSGIEVLGNSWFRVWNDVSTDVNSTIEFRFEILDDSGTVSYTGDITKGFHIAGPMLELYDANQVSGPTDFVPVDTEVGSSWRILGDYDLADLGGGTEDYNSGWQNFTPQPGDLSDRDFVNSLLWVPAGLPYRYYRTEVLNANNLDGYFQAGRFYASNAFQLPLNPAPGWNPPTPFSSIAIDRTLAEFGELDNTREILRAGGEIWLPTLVDYEEYRDVIRKRIASKDVVFVMDPTGKKIHDEMLYAGARFGPGRETVGGLFRARIDLEEL